VNADILAAIRSPALFRPWFKRLETWAAWFVFLKALFALPMDDADHAIFAECTGRAMPPTEPVTEGWLVVGRRGGKSLILAVVAVFLAVFRDWSEHLVPGESALVQVIATDRKQARVIYRYARAMLLHVPTLKPMVASESGDVIELTNGISIEITTASYRAVRGYTIVAALCDEIAFWRSDENSANPDSEILDALRPAMATIPGAVLLAASSPYAKRGVLYQAHREHYGKDSPVLVWQAPTQRMNPVIPQSIIDRAYDRDPLSAAAEYGAQFRSDIAAFIAREVIDAVTVPDRFELPPMSRVSYCAFVDPSGGSSDSMTLAIAHTEGDAFDRAVLDAVREVRPPFSPESVVIEFADLLSRYEIHEVEGDRYAGEWPRERFREHGISYVPAEKPKSDIYKELLPSLNSTKVELLDNSRLQSQLAGLERRTARGGRDSIDHSPGAHDDLANSVAGALVRALTGANGLNIWARLAD
jgi:hypothetical protein